MSQLHDSSGSLNAALRPVQSASPTDSPQRYTVDYRAADFPFDRTVYSSGADMAAQLNQALGGAGQIVGQLGNIAAHDEAQAQRLKDRQEYEQEKAQRAREIEQAKKDRLDEKAQKQQEILQEGFAATDARVDAAKHLDAINKGLTPTPYDNESVVRITDGLIKDATDGKPMAYVDAYRKAITNFLDTAFHKKIAENEKRLDDMVLQGATSAATAGTFEQAVRSKEALMGAIPTLTDLQATTATVLQWTKLNALAGREKEFEQGAKELGDMFKPQVEELRLHLASVKNRDQAQIDKNFIDQSSAFSASRTLYPPTDPKHIPLQVQFDYLKTMAEKGGISPHVYESQLNQLRVEQDGEQKELLKKQYQFEKSSFESGLLENFNAMISGASGADLAMAMATGDTVEIPSAIPGESPHKYSKKEMLQTAVDAKLGQIDQNFPPNSPMNTIAKAKFLSQYPEAVNTEWKAKLSSVMQRVGANTTRDNADPMAVEAVQLAKVLLTQYPGVFDAHTRPSDREAIRMAANMSDVMKIEPGDALGKVVKISLNSTMSDLKNVSIGTDISDSLDSALTKKFGNAEKYPHLLGEAKEHTRIASLFFNGNMDDASKYVIKNFENDYKVLGGELVRTAGRPAIANIDFDAVSEAVVGAFKHNFTEYKDEDIRLGQEPLGNMWAIRSSSRPDIGGMPISDRDLAVINSYMVSLENQKRLAAVRQDQDKSQRLLRESPTYRSLVGTAHMDEPMLEGLSRAGGLYNVGPKVLANAAAGAFKSLSSPGKKFDPKEPPMPDVSPGIKPILVFIRDRWKDKGVRPTTGPLIEEIKTVRTGNRPIQ